MRSGVVSVSFGIMVFLLALLLGCGNETRQELDSLEYRAMQDSIRQMEETNRRMEERLDKLSVPTEEATQIVGEPMTPDGKSEEPSHAEPVIVPQASITPEVEMSAPTPESSSAISSPVFPGVELQTGQVFQYEILVDPDGDYEGRIDGNAALGLIKAGALTIGKNDEKSLLTYSYRYHHRNNVFYAREENAPGIATWFGNLKTLYGPTTLLIYEEWQGSNEPLPDELPNNFYLEYLVPDNSHHPLTNESYSNIGNAGYISSGMTRFGTPDLDECVASYESSGLDAEQCSENHQQCTESNDESSSACQKLKGYYRLDRSSHSRIIAWHQSLEYLVNRELTLFWRAVAEYGESSYPVADEDLHETYRYYQTNQYNNLEPISPETFNQKEKHPNCLCVDGFRHNEVLQWFAAHQAVEQTNMRLFWAPLYSVK